jgi:N-acetylmuramoyl-L-alanine amidase
MRFILKKGDRGSRVTELQNLLKRNGVWTHPSITDFFGPVTERAVIQFQRSKKIKDDGIVGPVTWGKLVEIDNVIVKPVISVNVAAEDKSDPEEEMLVENIKEVFPTCKNIRELVKLINEYKMTRNINRIIYHCTATQPTATVAAILNYWQNTLKWKVPGYHIIVTADGSWTLLYDFNKVSNGVAGRNSDAIHVSYVGGIDRTGKAKDTRTEGQKAVFEACYHLFKVKIPKATHHGHNEFSNKACPSFKVDNWIKEIV